MYTIETALTKLGVGKFHLFLLVILGIIHSCDAIEMLILAFLGPILTCYWKITVIEASFLTTGVFIGIMIGSSLLGNFSDKYGRKTTLIITNSGLLYFGILSANAPTIYWMIIMRCFIGICIGGNSSSLYSLLSELTPLNSRGIFLVSLQLFWAFGSILITTLCLVIVKTFGWKLFLILATTPIYFVLVCLFWIPESPRYLLLQNQKEKSLEIINKVAKMNKVEPITELLEEPMSMSSNDLIHSNYLLTTIFTCFLWFVAGLSYYSMILILTILTELPHRCLQNRNVLSTSLTSNLNKSNDNSCCFDINLSGFRNIYISTVGEIVFVPLSLFLVLSIGRKKTLSTFIFITSVGIFLLNLCLKEWILNLLLFVLRGSLMSFMNINFLYAIEVFPTSVRSFGSGMCNFSSRLGAIISPFIVNIVIVNYSFLLGTMILSVVNLIAFVISFLLPYETKNRKLYQTADHDDVITKIKTPDQKENHETLK